MIKINYTVWIVCMYVYPLTSLSVAVSIPLTNTIKAKSSAIAKFRWTKCCIPVNNVFLQIYKCNIMQCYVNRCIDTNL